MALIQCGFYSDILSLSVSMNVIVPQALAMNAGGTGWENGGRRLPVLYLLHGLSDDHSTWLRRTSIERYAEERGVAVVMPEVHRSFYSDIGKYRQYWTFVSKELPSIAEALFPVATDRSGRFVAGLSMGGYGAFKLALRLPERYAAAASLSGALDFAGIGAFMGDEAQEVFGDRPAAGSDNDLFALAERLARGAADKEALPAFYQCCGTEDFLYDDNRRFLDHVRKLGLSLTYEEGPGTHAWDYWDAHIRKVLDWLPLEKANRPI
ncbi:alpha/beta hydrolase [Cohnella sp.]|uniref:alpha/beta hydrolase n=1 Tax=Cohnella sp. TaxID=1883426 RepID=UPI003703CD39